MFFPAIKLHLVWGFTSWSRFITGGYLICNYLGCHMSSGCKSPVEWWFCGFISWRISINQSVQCRGTVFEHCEAMESRNSRVRVVAMIARHGDSELFLLLMLTKNWLSGFGFHIFSHIFYFLWGVETANQLDFCHIGLSLSTKGYFDVVTPGIGGSWAFPRIGWWYNWQEPPDISNTTTLPTMENPVGFPWKPTHWNSRHFTRSTHGFVPNWKLPKYLLHRCVTVVLSSTQQSQ